MGCTASTIGATAPLELPHLPAREQQGLRKSGDTTTASHCGTRSIPPDRGPSGAPGVASAPEPGALISSSAFAGKKEQETPRDATCRSSGHTGCGPPFEFRVEKSPFSRDAQAYAKLIQRSLQCETLERAAATKSCGEGGSAAAS